MSKYKSLVRTNKGTVMWGYEVDPNDDQLLIPIDAHLDALYEALDNYKRYYLAGIRDKSKGLRPHAAWVSAVTGSPMTYQCFRSHFLKYKKAKYKKPLNID